MRAVILPGPALGTVSAPPSKSMAHRLLICAALAEGVSLIGNVPSCQDALATLDGLTALGARFAREGSDIRMTGCDPRKASSALLFCRDSASTLRFLLPLCLLNGQPMRLRGSEGLMARPMRVYETLFRARGILFEQTGCEIRVAGRLSGGEYEVPGGVSSQFISGLLFALPLLDKESVIRLLPPVESRPYLDMTVETLRLFGVSVRWLDETALFVPGNSAYTARDAAVEGDFTAAAYFDALNLIGGKVCVSGLPENSLQGDRVYSQYFSALKQGFASLDVSDCPDLAPILMAAAAARSGVRLTGTRRLRFKESDRTAAMTGELAQFGVRTEVSDNAITVCPGSLHAPAEPLQSHGDHRVAMALAALCTKTGGEIEGAECVQKSLPDFWDRLVRLGVQVKMKESGAASGQEDEL